MAAKILILEDDESIRSMLVVNFKNIILQYINVQRRGSSFRCTNPSRY